MSKRAWMTWLLGSGVGIALVAAPDADQRLFSISRTHGPSLVDAIGFAIILLAWSILWGSVWKKRSRLPANRQLRWFVGVVAACAAVLLIWSIFGDHGLWWILGAGVLAALQITAAAIITSVEQREAPRHRDAEPFPIGGQRRSSAPERAPTRAIRR